MVYLIAMQSKDPCTKVGAVIVGTDNEVRSTGYNGLPRGCVDDNPNRDTRPEKYYWYEHAERNAIYNAARMGLSVKGCTLYTQGIPCADCARAVIQSGITEVITHAEWNANSPPKWEESAKRSLEMFEETGVNLLEWHGNLLEIERFQRW